MGEYQTTLSLRGVPKVETFVDRPAEMAKLEETVLPQRGTTSQKVLGLHGLGGAGKTQLAVEFVRRYHRRFSSVFWLDGSREDRLKLSIAECATRIPTHQISDASRTSLAGPEGSIDEVVGEVMSWLERPDNTKWLMVFDNVNREYHPDIADSLAYDVDQYIPSGVHGSVLITTRLMPSVQQIGSKLVGKMDGAQARKLLESWYKDELGKFNLRLKDCRLERADKLQTGMNVRNSLACLTVFHWRSRKLLRTCSRLGSVRAHTSNFTTNSGRN